MPHRHWVTRQNKLEIPHDKDEVNKHAIQRGAEFSFFPGCVKKIGFVGKLFCFFFSLSPPFSMSPFLRSSISLFFFGQYKKFFVEILYLRSLFAKLTT